MILHVLITFYLYRLIGHMRTRFPPISSDYKSTDSSFSDSRNSIAGGPGGYVHVVEVPPQGGHVNVVRRPGEPPPADAGGYVNVGRGAGRGGDAANMGAHPAPQRGRGAANVRRGGGGGAVNVRH
ncbi:hypothetical protein IFR04_012419 [Cadophora malorum]|uniref:Uncharacterized protein n=1 Tax=Cadophora malorum TaxID=108018 RepID=A0A8H7T8Y1_9HELO|nr:hypothetical protein IFR04_012419 [Cadophora malorum]